MILIKTWQPNVHLRRTSFFSLLRSCIDAEAQKMPPLSKLPIDWMSWHTGTLFWPWKAWGDKENFPNSLPCRLSMQSQISAWSAIVCSTWSILLCGKNSTFNSWRTWPMSWHDSLQLKTSTSPYLHASTYVSSTLHQRRLAVESFAFCSTIHWHLGWGDAWTPFSTPGNPFCSAKAGPY